MKAVHLKIVDCVAYVLLLIGALNWGLVGIFGFDLVATIFGEMAVVTRIIYVLVGLAAVYDILGFKTIWRRWGVHLRTPAHA
jgi:uncharacterized membrane protein YuzA (DUF378 family)